jgi:MFS family permease
MIFFIFVDVNIYTVKPTENPTNKDDYITDKKGNPVTSFPNTSSPLMQNGIRLLENKNAPVMYPNLQVKYLPKKFDNVYDIDYFVLLVFFTALMLSILFFTLLVFINMFLPFLNPLISIVSSIIGFALSFCLLYFYYPKENQIILLYILITFVFSLLSAPVALMVFEIFTLLFTKKSISQYGNLGWYLLVIILAIILGYMIPAAFTTDIFNVNNILTGTSNNSNTIQLITVFLIAMTVGWFFGLSFHFEMFSLLFVIAFTPMKYVVKVFAPITILGLTITQIILASNASNQQSKVTEGYQSNT